MIAFSVGIIILNQRIIWKDDIEFVTEVPCLLGHPVVKDLEEEDILKNRNFHGNQLTMNTETKKWVFFSTLIKLKLKSDINIFLSTPRQTHQGCPNSQ